MKTKFLKQIKMLIAPLALGAALVAFSPGAALAAGHGGGHGFGGGGHAFSGSVHSNFNGNHSVGGYHYGNRPYGGYTGGHYYGGRYYGPSFSFGIYAAPSYGYAAPVCDPAGFYDEAGYWHYYSGCEVPPPYGY